MRGSLTTLWLLIMMLVGICGRTVGLADGVSLRERMLLEPQLQLEPRQEVHRRRVGTVVVKGAKFFSATHILRVSGLIPRTVLTEETLQKATARIEKAYADRGYAAARVSIDQNRRPPAPGAKTEIVDLTINVREGPIFFVHHVEFVGNVKAQDEMLRRILLIREGQRYNPALVGKSLQRLNQTGWFEELTNDDVKIALNEAESQVDITFYVRERGRR